MGPEFFSHLHYIFIEILVFTLAGISGYKWIRHEWPRSRKRRRR